MNDPSPGVIKGYELREQIGSGGFGAVYRAYQAVVDREVAIKVILPEYANQPEFIRSFEAEAQLVARLEHPHIVPLYDYWREPDGAYLVMRYLRGGSLTDLLKNGPMALDVVSNVLEQVTAALSVAHRNKVVHRDIKPDNVVLDEEGNVYLTDFGIAKAVGYQTTDQNVSGSLRYMAPEQLASQPPTPAVDIYSLGLVIYEMVTGTHPFEGATPSQLINHHLHETIPPLSLDFPAALNDLIQKATAKDPLIRYQEPREIAADFRKAILPADAVQIESSWDGGEIVNPYKGLRAFQTADANDFFGREALVEQLVLRLRETGDLSRFLAVVGPSGSGKSSVVHAGLIPALWSGAVDGSADWFVVNMTPGTHPLRQLESALLGVAAKATSDLYEMLTVNRSGLLWAGDRILGRLDTELLLVVDQFEELFTLAEDEAERDHFLDLLFAAVTAPDGRVRVIITLRADFTDKPLEYVDFGELLRHRTEFVVPLSANEIERAITGPASRVGLQVDSNLLAAVVSDVREEPGALPLLQYALTEVYARRENHTLTLAAYQQSGGVLGALARRAEQVYRALDVAEQEASRQVFLRLVTLGEGSEDTRRRVTRSELAAVVTDPAILQAVLDDFGEFRLLAFDSELGTREPTVDVAHEALIREWGQLRGWLDDGRVDVRLQRMLAAAATEWREAGNDPSYLLPGARLAQFEEWATGTDIVLTGEERRYLLASVEGRQRLEEEERLRREHELELERRSRNRMRALAVVLAVGIVIAVLLSGFAFSQSQVAQDERDNALAAQETSDANAVIAQANAGTAQARGTEVAGQVETVQAAQGTAVYEAANAATQERIAQDNAQTSEANAVEAQANFATAEARGTEVAQQVAVAQAAQATAVYEADNAATQERIAQDNANDAQNNAATAQARGTEVAVQVVTSDANAADALNNAATATIAQGEAQFQAETAIAAQATSDANALEAQARGTEVALQVLTSDANALEAQANAATATFAQGDAQFQAETAIAAQSTSDANAIDAENSAATAQARGTEVALQVETSDANAQIAADNAATADANAQLAADSEGTAVAALTISEESGRLARGQALAASAEDLLVAGNIDLALALALESANLNPDLIQAQSVMNRALGLSPVLIAPRVSSGYELSWTLTGYEAVVRMKLVDRMTGEFLETNEEVKTVNYNAMFSPDGRYLLTATGTTLILRDLTTGEIVHSISEGRGNVRQIAFSPDGRHIVAATVTGLKIFETESGQLVLHSREQFVVNAVALHPDGTVVASGGQGPPIILWDIETGEEIRRLDLPADHVVYRLAFGPDGSTLYSWSYLRETAGVWSNDRFFMQQWNPATGSLRSQWDNILYRGFNRQGSIAWTGGLRMLYALGSGIDSRNTGSLTLRYPENGVEQQVLDNGFDWRIDSIRFIDFSPDNSKVLVGIERYAEAIYDAPSNNWPVSPFGLVLDQTAGTAEHRVVVVDLNTGAVLNRIENNDLARITSAVFAADNQTVLSATHDNRVILWDAPSGDIIRMIGASGEPMIALSFSADEQYALTLTESNTAQVWGVGRDGVGEIRRIAVEGGVRDIAFSPDNDQLYAGSDRSLVILDRDTGTEINRYDVGNPIHTVAFSTILPQALVSAAIRDVEIEDWDVEKHIWDPRIGDPGGRAFLWNLETGTVDATFGDRTSEIYAVAISADGQYAFLQDQLWNIKTNQSVEAVPTGPEPLERVFGVAFSPDNQYFVDAVGDRYLRIRPLELDDSTTLIRDLDGLPTRADFSPDDKSCLIGISYPENVMLLWDVEAEGVVRRFVGHTDTVNDVAFSPDGTRALSASEDGTVILWDVATGQPIRTYTGHYNPVRRVEFNRDGRSAISSDGVEIIEWRVDTLASLVQWIDANLEVPELSCEQREQYNVLPLCEAPTATPAP